MYGKLLVGMVGMVLSAGVFAAPLAGGQGVERVIGDARVPIEFKVEGQGFEARMVAFRLRGLGERHCVEAGGNVVRHDANIRGCTFEDGGYVRIDESVQAGMIVVTMEPSAMTNRAEFSDWVSVRNGDAETVTDGMVIFRKSKH